MVATPMLHKPKKDTGLKQALLFEDGYDRWGWWCPKCTRPGLLISQDGYVSRDKARRSAHKHEARRGH
jgi:hypothetical protein